MVHLEHHIHWKHSLSSCYNWSNISKYQLSIQRSRSHKYVKLWIPFHSKFNSNKMKCPLNGRWWIKESAINAPFFFSLLYFWPFSVFYLSEIQLTAEFLKHIISFRCLSNQAWLCHCGHRNSFYHRYVNWTMYWRFYHCYQSIWICDYTIMWYTLRNTQ